MIERGPPLATPLLESQQGKLCSSPPGALPVSYHARICSASNLMRIQYQCPEVCFMCGSKWKEIRTNFDPPTIPAIVVKISKL